MFSGLVAYESCQRGLSETQVRVGCCAGCGRRVYRAENWWNRVGFLVFSSFIAYVSWHGWSGVGACVGGE